MTSSLPNFAPAPASAGAAAPNSTGFAGFGATASPTSPGDFADLMSEQDAAADCPEMATAMPSFTILAPTLISLLAAPAEAPAEVAALPATAAADKAAPTAGGITRDIMEQAASLLATILQSMLPEAAPAVPQALGVRPCLPAATQAVAAPGSAALTATTVSAPAAATTASETPATPTATPTAAPATLAIAPQTRATATETSSAVTATPVAAPAAAAAATETPTATPAQFEVSLAADGAVEIKAELPKEQGSTDQTGAFHAGAFEIEAEIALPGQAVMRLSAATPAGGEFPAKAKFAAKISAGRVHHNSSNGAVEINFLTPDNKQVKTEFTESGIAVAKPGVTMNTPTEATRATSNSDMMGDFSARGQFTVAWPSAERAQGPVPVEKNFAERAVATVSNLVDTQFTASMQKSGSVQLRLKFGGEDLSVRVELRGGAVHTDFRTDSPELRAALNREWQAVASQSSHSLRAFVDPVFSPSSSSGDDAYAPRQQAGQQDLSQQSRNPRAREEETSSPFARRSLVGEIFSPQPVAPRAPAYVSTSLRLSVLA